MADWIPSTWEDILKDFLARKAGIRKALTTDVKKFSKECAPAPGQKDMCLYGLPNETWLVVLPPENDELPKPSLGINFSLEAMGSSWLTMVASESDDWLEKVALYYARRANLDDNTKRRLNQEMNRSETLYEVLMAMESTDQKRENRISVSKPRNGNPDRPKVGEGVGPRDLLLRELATRWGPDRCRYCAKLRGPDGSWVRCKACKFWFHLECTDLEPEEPDLWDHFKCSFCIAARK